MLAAKVTAVMLSSAAIGILYRVPRSVLLYGSATAVLGWLCMYNVNQAGGNIILANFIASVIIGIMAEGWARLLKKPATVFIIPAFIPLVPGSEAYATVVNMVEGHYVEGVSMAMRTIFTAGAIAFGIFVSSTAIRLASNKQRSNTESA